MSTQVQLRRDTAANVAAFTGAQGEVVVDTTNNRLVVQDGATAGGFAAAKLSEVLTISAATLLAQGGAWRRHNAWLSGATRDARGRDDEFDRADSEWRDRARGLEPGRHRDHRRDLV